MKKSLFLILTLALTSSAFADETCESRIGFKEFAIEGKNGSLSSGKGLKLIYWENNQKKTVRDAKIEVLKIQLFNTETKTGHNGMGERWTTLLTDYAVRVSVKTKSTEIYPRAMGNPAVKEMEFSTMCTQSSTVDRR